MQLNQHITELGSLLEKFGVRHVVIAPGSRNAPLIQLFTGGKAFTCYSVVDERSAGYLALGMARALQEPTVIVTTSGTAVLNLAPAIAEAFYQQIPLIILSADRPLESIRQFNNQAIDQVAPFYNHTKGFYELPPEPRDEHELLTALSAVNYLFQEASQLPRGPVHVNVPLVEPLYEQLPPPLGTRIAEEVTPVHEFPDIKGPFLVPIHRKILLLNGMGMRNPAMASLLGRLASCRQVVTIAENIANLASDLFIGNPELILAGARDQELEGLTPDLVIAWGGQVVSKRLKNFIQDCHDIEVIELEGDPMESIGNLEQIPEGGAPFFENSYLKNWKELESRLLDKAKKAIGESSFSNLSAIAEILDRLPLGTVVHLGNSATIRYSQLVTVRGDLTYYSNRGTSGIDGCVSTAVGAALVSEALHVLLVGDLSFVYDSNSLWNKDFPANLKIVVLNDGGGGIFRLLEGPDRMNFFEEFSVTQHPVSIELLSQAFGRTFHRASNMEELIDKLELLLQSGSSASILEVDTTGSQNSRIFKSFFNQIR